MPGPAKTGLIVQQVLKTILGVQKEPLHEVVMSIAVKFVTFVLALATACSAQDGLRIRNSGNQKWPAGEAQKIYLSACSAVQQEFGRTLPLAPQVTLVLGADKNEVWLVGGEVRLTKWNPDAFAQGVVWLAFEDLLPSQQRLSIAKRAVNRADSTIEVEQLRK
jgi:hypothetical protein